MAVPMMPRWKCHKEVYASKIIEIVKDHEGPKWLLECGLVVAVPQDVKLGKATTAIGGYYVLYDDGYESWSPYEAFQQGYTQIGE